MRMMLSSSPFHHHANSFFAMVFPVDRPWNAAVCLWFFFVAKLHNVREETLDFTITPKCLFVCVAGCGGKHNASQRQTINDCFVVGVKWWFQNRVMLYRLCFLRFTCSAFVFYA